MSQQHQQQQRQPQKARRKTGKVYTDRQVKQITRGVGTLIVGGLVAWLVVSQMGSGAPRNSNGDITQSALVDVTSLRAGDCFLSGADGQDVSMVTATPCSQAHSGQILGFVMMTDSTYPSATDLQNEADSGCTPFWNKVSATALPEDAAQAYLAPATADDFNQGNRKIACVEQSPSSALTSSVMG